ncbi:MAG: tetratricopeptide repeat protein [Prevotella sp.]|nr:tetratricopeptide repeat protein [Prevotella sp.]MBR2035185.1 tetratricopeptide repeat protein [Prevotella sp.]
MLAMAGCSTQKNDAKSRWWHSFTARYNTYYNGSQAFIEGSIEKENANKDNFTEMIPLYMVSNKNSKSTGLMKFDRAIEKSEKAIKQHSIKKRPEWTKNRRKTAKDIEWLNRKEYNPFLWKAWLLLGKSQFQKGNFDEAAATFSYMSRLYSTQPAINGIARAWLAKSYVELDWLYDAEDVMTKMLRDTIHYRAQKDWDYTFADYYIKSGQLEQAVPYLQKVIKHERRKKLKARQWYLMGQIQYVLGNKEEAYKAYQKVIHQHPPYELEFNARIAQTEVMAGGRSKQMISKLKRMARSDNNKDYLDQVYYAMGNIYLLQADTANAIGAYEKGNKESTRNGIEKGVLLLKLGDLYWVKEKYNDAQRCYGEAIGLLDKERPDYEQLSERSKVLDELVPHTDAVYLQDSLQVLADLPEEERNKAIDRVIEELKKKEEEEKKAAQEAEAEKVLQRQGATGNRNNMANRPPAGGQQQGGAWYFYNPMAVNQGKTAFQRQWGKRENTDDWQRINRTVVNLQTTGEGGEELTDSTALAVSDSLMTDSIATEETADAAADTLANDPHNREYYLAQIPFTEEQKAASNEIIMEGLFNSGVIFKDKLDNLKLGEKALTRLTRQYPTYSKTDEAWYHLFLLYSRLGNNAKADSCLTHLKADFPESDFTILLSDPFFEENARFGVHIEDSLYAATYEAFRKDRYQEIKANAKISRERFPLGENRPKFIFIEGLGMLNDGDAVSCLANMKEVVEKYPQSEVSEMAGMIIKGVQEGRKLHGGKFDLGDIWSRRSMTVEVSDSTIADTLTVDRNVNYVFLLAFNADSVNSNQLLYDMAKYNFTNFMVRNFDIGVDEDNGVSRMLISGFLNYDEALQYARQLYSDEEMPDKLKGCKRIIISEENLKLLGTKYSYEEYDNFFEQALAPLQISNEQLLIIPTTVEQAEDPETEEAGNETEEEADVDDLFMEDVNNEPVNGGFDFDEDFYR